MIIAITGTPGVGKSTVAKEAGKKLGYKVMEINKVLGIESDREASVSVSRINKEITSRLEDNTIIVSHLSHFLKDKRIRMFFVLRCSPPTLINRLKNRHYQKSKIYDNAMFEAIDGTMLETTEFHRNIVQMDNTKNLRRNVNEIISFVKTGKKPVSEKCDYSGYILNIERTLGK